MCLVPVADMINAPTGPTHAAVLQQANVACMTDSETTGLASMFQCRALRPISKGSEVMVVFLFILFFSVH